MARKRYKPEEIVAKLRQVDVLVSQGQNMVDAIRQIGVSEVTYYRWRCVPACEPPAPSRGRLTDVKAPRHVSLRFAVSKSLDRFLPLMRGQGCRSPEFHVTSLRASSTLACAGSTTNTKGTKYPFAGCSWTRLNAENATGSCL